eukprot:m.110297 g.110297  ORF g.110297 m.110297 type:complete len:59 (-) comp51797_c0_seq4:2684-2860(-)
MGDILPQFDGMLAMLGVALVGVLLVLALVFILWQIVRKVLPRQFPFLRELFNPDDHKH